MKQNFAITHEFVDLISRDLKERTLYVSIEFATVTHKCFCGCGSEVVTPLSPVQWQLTFDGETVSLHPSVGSWSLKCQSHYWIRRNRVEWAPVMSLEEIAAVRRHDDADRRRHFGKPDAAPAPPPMMAEPTMPPRAGFWARLVRLFRRSQ
jgi:hypothetical protein